MHDSRSHPLLEQVPLAVSPFVHLPRATTLPYRYKTMPSALPPSAIEGGQAAQGPSSGAGVPPKPAYVTSPASASAAHPDDILASCRALRDHVARMQADADAELAQLEARIQARELAEKRRVAPGWLDSEDRLLVPERTYPEAGAAVMDATAGEGGMGAGSLALPSEMAAAVPEPAGAGRGGLTGEELDRAFGGMGLR